MDMEIDLEKLVSEMDFKSNEFVTCKNGLMLTNMEIDVLKRYGVDYERCSTLKEIIYLVEDILNEEDAGDDLDELEYISSTISERDYYQNTNK